MSASKLLKIMLLFMGAILSQPVIASVGTIPQSAVANGNIGNPAILPYGESLLDANKMLSYVNLAYIAIDMRMFNRAVSDIREAQAIASDLEKDSPVYVSEAKLKYGKLTYDIKGVEVSYYIPMTNDKFVIPDYDGFLKSRNTAEIIGRDARMVSASMEVDLHRDRKLLSNAFNDIKYERYNSARVELTELHQNALIAEADVKDPVWSIHDNLRLTQALLDANQYSSAEYSLEHAREQLDRFKQNTAPLADSKIILNLDTEIIAMEMQLRGKSPVIVQKAERKIGQWINTVDGWMNASNRSIN